MDPLEQIKARIESAISGAKIEIIPNGSPSQQASLLIDNEHAVAIARFLRDDPELTLDFCSNVSGVDWLARTVKKTVRRARRSLRVIWKRFTICIPSRESMGR